MCEALISLVCLAKIALLDAFDALRKGSESADIARRSGRVRPRAKRRSGRMRPRATLRKFAAHMSSDITHYDEYSRFVRHAMEHLEQQQHRIRRALRDRDRHTLRRAGSALTLHLR